MSEKVLNNKKNGMAMLILFLLLYAAAILGCVDASTTWNASLLKKQLYL